MSKQRRTAFLDSNTHRQPITYTLEKENAFLARFVFRLSLFSYLPDSASPGSPSLPNSATVYCLPRLFSQGVNHRVYTCVSLEACLRNLSGCWSSLCRCSAISRTLCSTGVAARLLPRWSEMAGFARMRTHKTTQSSTEAWRIWLDKSEKVRDGEIGLSRDSRARVGTDKVRRVRSKFQKTCKRQIKSWRWN